MKTLKRKTVDVSKIDNDFHIKPTNRPSKRILKDLYHRYINVRSEYLETRKEIDSYFTSTDSR